MLKLSLFLFGLLSILKVVFFLAQIVYISYVPFRNKWPKIYSGVPPSFFLACPSWIQPKITDLSLKSRRASFLNKKTCESHGKTSVKTYYANLARGALERKTFSVFNLNSAARL